MRTKNMVACPAAVLLLLNSSMVAADDVRPDNERSFLGKMYDDYAPDFMKSSDDKKDTMPDDLDLTFTEIVSKYGFQSDEYSLRTPDGYQLTTFRIRKNGLRQDAPAAYLQHGLLGSSDDFVLNKSENSPAFILANEGYDVWVGNNRGNRYSRKHVRLEPDSWDKDIKADFWDFSFQEMADKDALANLEYITNLTGQDKVTWIGHG